MIKTHWLKQLQLAFGVPVRRRKSSRSCESALESRTLLSGGTCVELPVEEVSAEEPLVADEGEKLDDSGELAPGFSEEFILWVNEDGIAVCGGYFPDTSEEAITSDSVQLDENGEPLPEGAWLRHTVVVDGGDAVTTEEDEVVADVELNPEVMFYNMAGGVETPSEETISETPRPTLEELVELNGQILADENGNVTLQLEPDPEVIAFKDPSSEYTGELPRGVWVLTSDVPPTEPEAPTETVVDAEIDPLIDSSGVGPVFNSGNQNEEVIQTTDAGPPDSVVIENGTPEEPPVETPVDPQVDPTIDPVIYYNTAGGGRGGDGEILPHYRGGNAQAARAARQQAALIRKQERVAQQAERKLAAQNRKAARAVQLASVRATRSTAKAARRAARQRSR